MREAMTAPFSASGSSRSDREARKRGRAVLVLRRKEGVRDESQFKEQLLDHAGNVQKRIVASIVGAS